MVVIVYRQVKSFMNPAIFVKSITACNQSKTVLFLAVIKEVIVTLRPSYIMTDSEV